MKKAFTLIEMSLVLAIIGLIIGGVLVGRDLVSVARVRAQISQIEKYQTAVNTFRGKYGYLPGDIPDPTANQYGFQARGANPGEGDGNGVIEGVQCKDCDPYTYGFAEGVGETTMVWVDLSAANLIDGGFNTAQTAQNPANPVPLSGIGAYFPAAKLGRGNYIYVWSGGCCFDWPYTGTSDEINYFGISAITTITNSYQLISQPGLTVSEVFNIDNKIDDGLPQSGRVTAMYVNFAGNPRTKWVSGSSPWYNGPAPGIATTAASTTCYDNGGNASAVMNYSMGQNSGSGINCALSFQF